MRWLGFCGQVEVRKVRLKLSVVDGFRKYVVEQLTACPSVKFRRLFLVFADKH